jgi:hypothetical protein
MGREQALDRLVAHERRRGRLTAAQRAWLRVEIDRARRKALKRAGRIERAQTARLRRLSALEREA